MVQCAREAISYNQEMMPGREDTKEARDEKCVIRVRDFLFFVTLCCRCVTHTFEVDKWSNIQA